MRLLKALALLLSTQSLSSAWVLPSSPRMAARTTTRFATVQDDATATTLAPEFEAALSGAKDKLKQVLPQEYHDKLYPFLAHFVQEYITASQKSYQAGNTEICDPQTTTQRILQGIGYGLKFGMGNDTYTFDVSHEALRGNPDTEDGNTVDYYAFGCDFFRPCMNLEKSVVLGRENLQQAMDQIAAGENVILLANHQSEADRK